MADMLSWLAQIYYMIIVMAPAAASTPNDVLVAVSSAAYANARNIITKLIGISCHW